MWFKDPTINRKTEISLIFVNYQISSFLPIDQLDLDVEERRAGPAGGSIVRPIKVKVLSFLLYQEVKVEKVLVNYIGGILNQIIRYFHSKSND